MIIEAKSFMMRLSILVILNLLPLSCETGCPSGWADGSNSGFVGCFKYVGSTYATLPYAIRQCKLADARAHLPYLPEIRTLADMANFGNFTQSSFNTQELMWMGIAAFGPANPNASYDWYYPAANASRFIRTPFNLPWSSVYNTTLMPLMCMTFGYQQFYAIRCYEIAKFLCHIRDQSEILTSSWIPMMTPVDNMFYGSGICPDTNWKYVSGICYCSVNTTNNVASARASCSAAYWASTLPFYVTSAAWQEFSNSLQQKMKVFFVLPKRCIPDMTWMCPGRILDANFCGLVSPDNLVEFWTAIPVSNVSIQSHPIRSQKNTGHLHYGRW